MSLTGLALATGASLVESSNIWHKMTMPPHHESLPGFRAQVTRKDPTFILAAGGFTTNNFAHKNPFAATYAHSHSVRKRPCEKQIHNQGDVRSSRNGGDLTTEREKLVSKQEQSKVD